MNHTFGTAYDQNPTRLKILVKRNRKYSRRKNTFLMSFFSTILLGLALAATRILFSG